MEQVVQLLFAVWSFSQSFQQILADLPTGDVCFGSLFNGPVASSLPRDVWLQTIKDERNQILQDIGFDDSAYTEPQLAFSRKSWVQAPVLLSDQFLFDHETGEFTVDRLLDDLNNRYGGVDQVLLLTSYPNIGCDERNQFDWIRDLPNGLEGLRDAVVEFNTNNVSVTFAYFPWDTGTTRELQDQCVFNFWECPTIGEELNNAECIQTDEGLTSSTCVPKSDPQILQLLLQSVGGQGIHGHTMSHIPSEFFDVSMSAGFPLAINSEKFPDIISQDFNWMASSWEVWPSSQKEPCISVPKWINARHMVRATNRYAKSKITDLQQAWINGAGFVTWENIWGVWNQISERDAAAIRALSRIMRHNFFSQDETSIFVSEDWEPLYPTLINNVYASIFPREDDVIYTIINKNGDHFKRTVIQVRDPSLQYLDCWNGVLLDLSGSNNTNLAVSIEANGFGCIYGFRNLNNENIDFIEDMAKLTSTGLTSLGADTMPLPQEMVEIKHISFKDQNLDGKILLPKAKSFNFKVDSVQIEGKTELPDNSGAQFPWEDTPTLSHLHDLEIEPFYIDQFPVTNAQFRTFLEDSKYVPKDFNNFVRHWDQLAVEGPLSLENRTFVDGDENKPVVWISIEDARAYSDFYGFRLPNDWELQYAAQSTDGRAFPWGNDFEDGKHVPEFTHEYSNPGPGNVGEHMDGCSVFGVCDLTGLVWQFTNEFSDGHNRFVLVRGGANYRPQFPTPDADAFSPGGWYFPDIKRLDQHAKLLLMSSGIDRAGTFGFRTVVDVSGGSGTSTFNKILHSTYTLIGGIVIVGAILVVVAVYCFRVGKRKRKEQLELKFLEQQLESDVQFQRMENDDRYHL